jgi:hypothetical protein
MIFKRGLWQIVLAVLLLVAQHGALAHQIRHLHDNIPGQSQQQEGKQKSQSGLCDFHVTFVQILGAVDSAVLPVLLAVNTLERGFNHLPLAYPANLVVPASRGPPALL